MAFKLPHPIDSVAMVVWVSGVPGVGKTSIGKALARRLGYEFIDIPEYVRVEGLAEGYDRRRRTAIVNPLKLRHSLERQIIEDGQYVLASHIVVRLSKIRASCIVLRINPLNLYRRLKRRGYDVGKIIENLEAEFVGACFVEAVKALGRGRVRQLDVTGQTVGRCVERALEIIGGASGDMVDWGGRLSQTELDRILRLMASGGIGRLSKVF